MARRPDAVVIGGGLVGLAVAAVAAERGLRVVLAYENRHGEASPAAAGMLAPSVEAELGPAHAFAIAARDRYPDYVGWLEQETGVAVPLNRLGAIQVALDAASLDAPAFASPAAGAERLDDRALHELEPSLAHAAGGVFHPLDGAVNNLVLLRALKHLVHAQSRVRLVPSAVVSLDAGDSGVTALTASGERIVAGAAVLATGAWASQLDGLPRALPVEPVRGQMLSIHGSPVRHVVFGAGGYVVPRGDGRTLVGATMEHVGFDPATTAEGIAQVRRIGEAICPQLAGRRMLNGWAGLRPMTPDGLPLIGRDRDRAALVYACGHSRNGVLLAPLTGDCVADVLTGVESRADLSPFDPARPFADRSTDTKPPTSAFDS